MFIIWQAVSLLQGCICSQPVITMAKSPKLANQLVSPPKPSLGFRRWLPSVVIEGIGFALLYGTYLAFAKVVFPSSDSIALRNAEFIVELSDGLGLSWELMWQRWTIDAGSLVVRVFNWYYLLAFWPSILSLAVFTYIRHQCLYRRYRTLIVISTILALISFSVFPVAPPRMLPGFVDTIQVYGPSIYGGEGMMPLYNSLASTPSLHFSWTVLTACVLWGLVWRHLRHLVLAYPSIHFVSIVVTGNHYVVDAVAGLIVVGLTLTLYVLVRRVNPKVLSLLRLCFTCRSKHR